MVIKKYKTIYKNARFIYRSLASLLENNLPAEATENINFTIFATGVITTEEKIIPINCIYEKLYLIDQFLSQYPKQKKSCLIALSKEQEYEYNIIINENTKLNPPLFINIPEIKTVFIDSLPHDLSLITNHINNHLHESSYSYEKEYHNNIIDYNTGTQIKKIQLHILNNLLLGYSEKNYEITEEKKR